MTLSPYVVEVGMMLARELGAPALWVPFAVQAKVETADGRADTIGVLSNNPFNLTDPGRAMRWAYFGQTGHYEGGSSSEWHTDFARFATLEGGVRAAAENYRSWTYRNVVATLRTGSAVNVARAIEWSPWSSDHYGYTLEAKVREVLAELVTMEEAEDMEAMQRRGAQLVAPYVRAGSFVRVANPTPDPARVRWLKTVTPDRLFANDAAILPWAMLTVAIDAEGGPLYLWDGPVDDCGMRCPHEGPCLATIERG